MSLSLIKMEIWWASLQLYTNLWARVFLQSFDRNQDGVLQKLEFEEFMSQLGVFLARQELRVVFDNFDQNKDGNIAYAEFVNVLKVSHIIQFIKRTNSRPPTSLNLAQQALKKA